MQGEGENVEQYAADILRLCSQLKEGNIDQIVLFVNGLRAKFLTFVVTRDINTLGVAERAAKLGVHIFTLLYIP